MAGDADGRHRVAVRRELQQERDPDAVRVLRLVAQVLQVRGRVPCRDRKPRPLRCEMERHEAAEARAQKPEAAVESRMTFEKSQHGARVFQTRADGRLVLAARPLAAPSEVDRARASPARIDAAPSRRYLSLSLPALRPCSATAQGTGADASGRWRTRASSAPGRTTVCRSWVKPR